MKMFYFILMTIMTSIITSCLKKDDNTPPPGFSGADLLSKTTITRDKETKAATFNIEGVTTWALYSGQSDETFELDDVISAGNKSGSFELPVPNDSRTYFYLETPEGTAILAERHLPMAGGYNFRDLGGFRTTDGRYTRWGKVFRSDELKNLTDEDLAYLNSLPLKTVVDFRSRQEIKEAPDKLPASLKERIELCITPGSLLSDLPVDQILSLTEEEAEAIMMDINMQLANSPEWIDQYKKFFALLQNADKTPLMYHCTAGKDRTGYTSFLLLQALGVDRKICMEDYLASNIYLEDKYGKYIERFPFLRALIEVKAKYLQTAIDSITTQYGSVEKYLTEVLDVDLDKMRELYLY